MGFKPTSASFNNHGDDWGSGMNQETHIYIYTYYVYNVYKHAQYCTMNGDQDKLSSVLMNCHKISIDFH